MGVSHWETGAHDKALELTEYGLETMQQAGMAVERLWRVGGAARSPVWRNIVADVTGLPIFLTQYGQWPALGAAILAGLGVGLFESLEAGQARFQHSTRPIDPDSSSRQRYDDSFEKYQRLTGFEAISVLGA